MNDYEITKDLRQYVKKIFICKHCGTCCKKDPIHLLPYDIDKLANYIGKPTEEFRKRYLKPHPNLSGEYAFKVTNPCKFYNGKLNKCKIYEARPSICQVYPFNTISVEINDGHPIFKVDSGCPEAIEIIQKITDDNVKLYRKKIQNLVGL